MEQIKVEIERKNKDYSIFIGSSILPKIADFIANNHKNKRIVIITDDKVKALYENKILEMDEVLECYQTSGSEDYILKVALGDIKQFSDFCFQKLATIPGVQNIKSSFIISAVKSTTQLPVKAQR